MATCYRCGAPTETHNRPSNMPRMLRRLGYETGDGIKKQVVVVILDNRDLRPT
jgi:hypothetical protein